MLLYHSSFKLTKSMDNAEEHLKISKMTIKSHVLLNSEDRGCILLGLFWLFLFPFRNNGIHGISISKRTLIHFENGILMAEVS